MRVNRTERDELVMFIVDMSNDLTDVKQVAKLAVFVSMLEKHQRHDESVKIVHKGLKDFINEVRSCEVS